MHTRERFVRSPSHVASTTPPSERRRSPLADINVLIATSEPSLSRAIERSLATVGACPAPIVSTVPKALYRTAHDPTLEAAIVDIDLDGRSALPLVAALIARKVPVVLLVDDVEQVQDEYRAAVDVLVRSRLETLADHLLAVMGIGRPSPAEPH